MVKIVVMLVDVAKNNLIENSDCNPEIGGYSYMKATTPIRSSVAFKKDEIEEIITIVKNATGLKPNLSEFVRTAVNEKLEFYRNAKLQVAGRKAG
ncbi:MAG: hypothetical protein L6Q54_10975 [Leptospiraceae bacterium]|nr:hypothetical protein [Leptospiraceae bacterium]MCK6381750.1 hypothetical protein [Leptospiraceae bacterium]NUM42747.1 hypothetical protein [Leptospiraceae bacterium]